MSLTIDASTPALLTQNAIFITSLASNALSPPAGSLLLVCAGFPSSTNAVTSITDSLGSHLTYTKLVAHTGGSTDMELWAADCPSSQTGMTVTMNFSNCKSQCIGVIVFTGAQNAAAQLNNATVSPANATTGDPVSPPTITVPSTSSGSFVIAGFGDFTSGNTPTPASGQTVTFNGNSYFFSDGGGAGDGCWFQTTTATTGGGSVTLNCTAPTNTTHVAAAEILAVGGTAATFTGFIPSRMPLGA